MKYILMKSLLNNLFVSILFILYSCKPSLNIEYDNSFFKDEYDTELSTSLYPWSLCVIFEKSLIKSHIFIQDFNSKNILFDGKLDNTIISNISKVIFVRNNPNNFDIKINGNLIHVERNIYQKYRYLVVKKIGNKYILRYINEYPNISFKELCEFASFPGSPKSSK